MAGVVLAGLIGPLVMLTDGVPSVTGAATNPQQPVYLALGDSVTFGYREPTTTPAPDYKNQASFVGYPEDVGSALGWRVINSACPGETSASLIDQHAQSYSCENTAPGAAVAYRVAFPLHVSYSGSQLAFAVGYLRAHPATRLVSLMIGANDLFVCQATTSDKCVSEFPAVLKKISANVVTILRSVRQNGRYGGQLIVVNYYSSTYAAPGQPSSFDETVINALNKAVDDAAGPFRVTIAPGFSAIGNAAQFSAGNSCTAGLITQLSVGGCGVHPTPAGQAVLAVAVASVIRR